MSFSPIAIVGRACVLPQALTPDALWDAVVQGRDLLSNAPAGEWGIRASEILTSDTRDARDRTWSDRGGYVAGFDQVFDPSGFAGLSPGEIRALDPLFQWVLHTARAALRDARLRGDVRIGAAFGNLGFPSKGLARFAEHTWLESDLPGVAGERPDPRNRFSAGMPATLLRAALELEGPCMALDAACASSLYAIKHACDWLHDGLVDAALAGAVSKCDDLFIHVGFSALAALSKSGVPRPFDKHADGLVPAEGAAFLTLKRLADAERDGDTIHGVIRGIGLSNDGRSGGLLAPAQEGQARALRQAYATSGIDPASISLVECHATGTVVGDGCEVRSMADVFGARTPLPVGSLKSNLGHLITAAGAAGIIKVLEAMKHKTIPPTIHCDDEIAAFTGTPFQPVKEARPWASTGPRRAAVSAFGFGGNNAHVILEEHHAGASAAVSPRPAATPIAVIGWGSIVGPASDRAALSEAIVRGRGLVERGEARTEEVELSLQGLRFPPNDLKQALGQQTLLLKAAREAIDDLAPLPRERTSVLVGMETDPEVARYGARWRLAEWRHALDADPTWLSNARDGVIPVLEAPGVLGTMPNVPANRLNAQFDFGGPSHVLFVEQDSGTAALTIALRALRAGEIDAALVGAVDLSCEPVHNAARADLGETTPPGDAAVVLVLARLADAESEGRPIYAILDDGDGVAVRAADDAIGEARAAQGLLDVVTAVVQVHHRARPGARPWLGAQRATVAPRKAAFPRIGVRPGPTLPRLPGSAPRLFVWSGKDAAEIAGRLDGDPNGPADRARLVIVAASDAELARRIDRARRHLREGAPAGEGVHFRASPAGGDLAFVYTGAGAAYAGMGDELLLALPELGSGLTSRFEGLEKALGWAYEDVRTPTVLQKLWGASALCQLHTDLSAVVGLEPRAAIGYSSGDSNALFGLGVWTDLDGMIADASSSRLFDQLLGGSFQVVERAWGRRPSWATWTVLAPVDDVRAAVAAQKDVHLAIIHTNQDVVISGDAAGCDRVLSAVGRDRAVRLDYDLAVHVPEARAVWDAWWSLHSRPVTPRPDVRFYRGGTAYTPARDACADAITEQAMGTYDFRAIVERAYADGARVFVEHGPRDACARWIRQILGERDHVVVSWDRRGRGVAPIFEAIGALVAAGVDVRHEELSQRLDGSPKKATGPTITLPAHPPRIVLAPPLGVDEPTVPLDRVREVVPEGVTRMSAAPKLPRVSEIGDAPLERAPVVEAPPPVPATGGGIYDRARAYQADVGRVHREFLAQQQALHEQFLRVRQNALIGLSQRMRAPVAPAAIVEPPSDVAGPPVPVPSELPVPAQVRPAPAPTPRADEKTPTGPTLTREQLETHSSGRISEIFGADFAPQDDYAVQVRMPEPPLLLADRMVGIDATPLSLGKGTIWTETDITWDRWYLHDGYITPGVMIECGQADLMLISWLGIDVKNNRGERKYRLLGCTLTYHDVLPSPGEVLRYDIHCDGHANQGPVRLFFFHYDCRVDGELRLTVRGGQAGFFSDQELADSAGILWRPETQEVVANPRLDAPPVAIEQRSFSAAEVKAFAESRPWDCFRHAAFDRTKTHNRTPHIQTGRMLFLSDVEMDPRGGPWQRGYLRSEVDVHPDDWFFAGHFKNDPCMPGTLMFDGCLQAMAFYLSAMGVTVDRDGWRFQPVMGEPFDLKCRGQVTPTSLKLTYEIFVEEFSAGPIPTLYADLLCTVDGLGAFHARRVGLQLVPDWPLTSRPQLLDGHIEPRPAATASYKGGHPFAFGYASLLACAWGKPSDAFGEMYKAFDGTRRVARLPGPPYHFMSRLTRIDGELGACVPGGEIELEYDVPESAWYFDENGNRTMPFAVLLEAALQPCGWLASFVGSALTVDEDLAFRNLDGTGTLNKELFSDAGTLRTKVKITNISKSAGMIIESFDVECFLGDDSVYTMQTVFGFFPKVALENQIGLPTTDDQRALLSRDGGRSIDLRRRGAPRLAQPMLLMVDRAEMWENGGAAGLGTLRGHKDVDPHEWFFKAHFFQDPVQPGSLGIEAMIQLLQLYMVETGMGEGIPDARFEPLALGKPLTWKYRGQVVPTNKLIQSTVEITERGKDENGNPYAVADASLWVDGKRIYEAKRMAMRIVSGTPTEKRRRVLDPAVDRWLGDHQPTWTVPALPMMSMIDLLAQHADEHVTRLTDIKVKRWLTLPGPREVWTTQDGDRVTLWADGPEEIASARVSVGDYEQPRASLTPIDGTPATDPYASGELFHGTAFQRLRSLRVGANGSSAILDASPTTVPVGALHPVLLDAATHGIPHDRLHLWEPKIAEDKVAYPAFVPELQIFSPPPTTGTIRAEVRYTGLFAPDMPTFEVQLVRADGTLWARMKLVEACFPKGPLGLAAPGDRRAFLRDRQFVEGLRLSRVVNGATHLSAPEVDATDWLPGTVERIYGTREVAGIAVREHVAADQKIHPGLVLDALPLTRHHTKVTVEGSDVIVESARPATLDLAPVRKFWTQYFGRGPWPVEDLYYGLIQRFVRRVVLADPQGFAQLSGRSVLYLSNHQVGVESLLFSIVASALQQMPTVTLAKVEHQKTWLGRLISHSFVYEGIRDPGVIAFFDRNDKASLPGILVELAAQMKSPGRSVMVHVEGTRSRSATHAVEKMSGAFLDMAIEVGAPVVPVRFIGGLPREPLEMRIEFPFAMGQQDIWFGKPIAPEELKAVPYGDRKKLVVEAINALGVRNADEEMLPGNPEFGRTVGAWCAERHVDVEHATLWRVLESTPEPCAETRMLIEAVRAKKLPADPWLAELAIRLGGKR